MVVVGGLNTAARDSRMMWNSSTGTEVWNGTTGTWTQLPTKLPIRGFINGFVKLGDDLVCFVGGDDPSVYCLFSSKGLLAHQRRQIRFAESKPELQVMEKLEAQFEQHERVTQLQREQLQLDEFSQKRKPSGLDGERP